MISYSLIKSIPSVRVLGLIITLTFIPFSSNILAARAASETTPTSLEMGLEMGRRDRVLVSQARTGDIPTNLCYSSFRIVRTNDGSRLNLRANSGQHSALVGTVAHGTEVMFNVSDRSGEWAEITLPGGQTGWVADRYLAYSPVSQSIFNGTLRVKTLDRTAVNLRLQPSLVGEIVGRVSHGTIVQFNHSVGYWTHVTTPDGRDGFIATNFLVCD